MTNRESTAGQLSSGAAVRGTGLALVQQLHYHELVPTIKRFSRCRIEMYFDDHGIPHFHIIGADGKRASIAIDTLTLLAGELNRRDAAEALLWARANSALLHAKWKELNS